MSVLPVLLTVNTIVYPLSHSQVALPPVTELIVTDPPFCTVPSPHEKSISTPYTIIVSSPDRMFP